MSQKNIAKKGSHLHTCYASMKQRCYYTNGSNYKYYGARGIAICDEWLVDKNNFFRWALDSGYAEGLSLDRVDGNGNYEPFNCRWVSLDTQKQNRRLRADNTSGYAGVFFSKQHDSYRVQIMVNKERIDLGLYKCKHDGAEKYNNYITKHNLEHRLNEITR